jgi:hypothetical protein
MKVAMTWRAAWKRLGETYRRPSSSRAITIRRVSLVASRVVQS